MEKARSDEDFARMRALGCGFILNDFPQDQHRILHHAICTYVNNMNINYGKIFFNTIEEAVKWLEENRGEEGENWHRCGYCGALGQKHSA